MRRFGVSKRSTSGYHFGTTPEELECPDTRRGETDRRPTREGGGSGGSSFHRRRFWSNKDVSNQDRETHCIFSCRQVTCRSKIPSRGNRMTILWHRRVRRRRGRRKRQRKDEHIYFGTPRLDQSGSSNVETSGDLRNCCRTVRIGSLLSIKRNDPPFRLRLEPLRVVPTGILQSSKGRLLSLNFFLT